MIIYKVSYYNGSNLLGGQFLEEWQLKSVKKLVDPYFLMFGLNVINVRMELVYEPDLLKSNLNIQEIGAI